ncbi:hypothetical protein KKD45_03805 [Patescibacteria group bacterium]|nr:hypothetical protein [Patescibacteria group bacterium]MBU4309623.1 hypothetical protein [Patescibacteria group bacterium]MBU4577989.1 hypothetical protein [Patescibacteria group bacterium]
MMRSISGTLSLMLSMAVLRTTLPEAADLLGQILVTSLTMVNGLLHHAGSLQI